MQAKSRSTVQTVENPYWPYGKCVDCSEIVEDMDEGFNCHGCQEPIHHSCATDVAGEDNELCLRCWKASS